MQSIQSLFLGIVLLAVAFVPVYASDKTTRALTLKEVQNLALENHPRIRAARSGSQAARDSQTKTEAAFMPHIVGSITVVGATNDARITSGWLLPNSASFTRAATGVMVKQLITDFGRTASLIESSELKARAGEQNIQTARLQTILEATQAYFKVLRAQAVLKVMDETVKARQLELTQIETLSKGGLRSTLDVSFAKVNLGEADIERRKSKNELGSAQASLAQALGSNENSKFEVLEEAMVSTSPPSLDAELNEAFEFRPDLRTVRLEHEAARKFAEAEGKLYRPTVEFMGSLNAAPWTQAPPGRLQEFNAIGGVIVSAPLFDGFENAARHDEAEAKAQAAGYNLSDAENQVLRDVKIAWLATNTAFEQLKPAQEQLEQAKQTLVLATSRYQIGLGSIVELSQAQLNLTKSAIQEADSRIEYLLRRLELDYQTGKIQQDAVSNPAYLPAENG